MTFKFVVKYLAKYQLFTKHLCMTSIFCYFLLVFHCKLQPIPDDSLEDGLKKYSNISFLIFIMGLGVFAQYVFYFFIPSENKSLNEIDIILHHLLFLILSISPCGSLSKQGKDTVMMCIIGLFLQDRHNEIVKNPFEILQS